MQTRIDEQVVGDTMLHCTNPWYSPVLSCMSVSCITSSAKPMLLIVKIEEEVFHNGTHLEGVPELIFEITLLENTSRVSL